MPEPQGAPKANRKHFLVQDQLGYLFYGPEVSEGTCFLLWKCQYVKLEGKGWGGGPSYIISPDPGILSKSTGSYS